MAKSNSHPLVILVSYTCFYSIVFLLSIGGNLVVLCDCYRRKKRRGRSSLKWLIANLAFADFAFTLLTILDVIGSLWTWLGGTVSCKIQGFLIEACYTASIMTLVVITFERRKAVVTPFSTRANISGSRTCKTLAVLWIVSLVIGSPLLYAYEVETGNTSGLFICSNAKFGKLGRQVYYSIHAVCFFIIPLIYMIYAQNAIFIALRSSAIPSKNDFTTASTDRHRKVAKILVALTVTFTICWAPFIIVRELIYFYLANEGYYWRACQLLVFLNAALDPILYGIYGNKMKRFFPRFFMGARYRNFAKEKVSNTIQLTSHLRINNASNRNSIYHGINQEELHREEGQSSQEETSLRTAVVVLKF